jgi:hypothetical protein
LPSNRVCGSFDRERMALRFGVSPFWCLGSVQRWRNGNTHDKAWHWKVHDFDHLVHFWNPQSTCIDEMSEIHFSILLSTCYSRYPASHLLIKP